MITRVLNVDQPSRRVRFRERFEDINTAGFKDAEQGHASRNAGGL